MYGNKGVFSVMYADMVPLVGLEPTAPGLQIRRSANLS